VIFPLACREELRELEEELILDDAVSQLVMRVSIGDDYRATDFFLC